MNWAATLTIALSYAAAAGSATLAVALVVILGALSAFLILLVLGSLASGWSAGDGEGV